MYQESKQKGFTLLEMMVVVSIIGLLTTLTLPSYQRYTQRAKFAEVIQASIPYKVGVTLCAYQQGELSACDTAGQDHIPSDFTSENNQNGYVKSITVGTEGAVTATSQNIKLAKKTAFTYTLKPTLQANGSCQWTVDDTDPDSCKRFHLC